MDDYPNHLRRAAADVTPDQSLATGYRSGVGIVLINAQGLIFSGKRRDGRDHPWQLPQGGLQDGESPARAVLREIIEELGTDRVTLLDTHPGWLAYDYPDRQISRRAALFRGQRHVWHLLRFDGVDSDIILTNPHGEFSDWRWSPAARIIEEAIPFKKLVYRQVLDNFAATIRQAAETKAVAAKLSDRRRARQRLGVG